MPEHIIFVDTETTQTPLINNKIYHKLLLGVAIHHRHRRDREKGSKQTKRFTEESEFWQYVSSKAINKTVLYLISHNAVFDFTVLQHIKHLSLLGYKCSFVYEGGVTFISKWRKDKHTIMILDNSNWFRGKLATWGNELDLPKLSMPTAIEGIEKMFKYCERDTEILYQLFVWYSRFLRSNDLGSWKYTIASSAFTAYRHKFMSHNIYIPDDEDEMLLARQSYHGGRTECFKVGEFTDGFYYKLDVNSMYPYVMKEYEYPTCFEKYVYRPRLSAVEKSLKNKSIIAEVLVKTDTPLYVFKKDERNVYPIGTFRTVLTTRELKVGFENNWIVDIWGCCVYRKRQLFDDYVHFFYKVKQEANKRDQKLLKSFAKLYLNSLYGKFGQRGFVDFVIGDNQDSQLKVSQGYNVRTKQRFTLRQVGHQVLYSEKANESYNSFCAIASHVTANARLMLYDLVKMSGRDNCFYCDTDSVIVNQTGFNNLEHLLDNDLLGKLKVEGVTRKVIINAAKDYLFGKTVVLKGVRSNAQKIGTNSYKQEIWPGLNSILRTGKERYFNYFQIKTLNPSIFSGNVLDNGNILPFTM